MGGMTTVLSALPAVLGSVEAVASSRNEKRGRAMEERQLAEAQRLQESQSAASAALEREKLALDTKATEEERRAALKRAVARQRASFGSQGVGSIIMSYPSGNDAPEEIPIIKADLTPIKSAPEEPGGMDVPYSDSTVLSSIGQGQPEGDSARIENLLAQANEDLSSKEEALQRAMGEELPADIAAQESEERIPQERGMFTDENKPAEAPAQTARAAQSTEGEIVPVPDQAGLEPAPEATTLLQKIDPAAPKAIGEESAQKIAESASATKPKLHAAATSPETIDFVRSALNEDLAEPKPPESISASEEEEVFSAPEAVASAPEAAAEEIAEPAAEIEPAAGAATAAVNVEPGSYYVQLASITDRSRADSEYGKLQKKFNVLNGLEYRVQEANLDKGTFYRIQAGPFSKDSAKSICDAIKEQKPGGCILVK